MPTSTVVMNEMHVCVGLQCVRMYITCITDTITIAPLPSQNLILSPLSHFLDEGLFSS